ncbi:hypothetical protein [Arenibacter lacus]|uniref:hypothetical protein n=1 Tax=Arenibacter lacus TaxID=2608629 RepID=UPI00123D4952|nr:hypothetical protein [Arenibacter lacus]
MQNVKDDVLLASLDILFDFSVLHPEKYHPSEPQSIPVFDEPVEGPYLPNRLGEDCIKFFHMDFGTIKRLLDETEQMESVNRFLCFYKARQILIEPEVNYERLLNVMSFEERLGFPVYDFPDQNSAPFYGHALNYLRISIRKEVGSLKRSLRDELEKEGNKLKKLFLNKRKQEVPFALMHRAALLLPLLVGFEQWKRLVIDALKNKELFSLLKTRLLFLLEELQQVIGERYFQDLTTNVKNKTHIVTDKETGINTLRSIKSPLVKSYEFVKWLKRLKATDVRVSVKNDADVVEEPKNEIIIAKSGSQLKLKKALVEFFAHLKLKINEEQDRAIESFLYRNFAFEYDEKIDFTKRFVNNFGYKPLNFIPQKHAKDFAKLFLYLADNKYILSNKTQIIRTLDEDIHEKNGKDGFSYSSLIRIPSDEHHLFPDNDIRRRIRSILKIDD